jgi:hypothetical protein
MKLSVETFEYTNTPGKKRRSTQKHLVSSACLVSDPLFKVLIEHKGELLCTGSTPESTSFEFHQEIDLSTWKITEVIITAETPEELVIIKGNQFRQYAKDRIVVVFLPWAEPEDEKIISAWRQSKI